MARKIAPIVIDLLVRGTPRVEDSVRRVRDVVIKAEGETVSGVVRAAAKRTQSAEKEAAARLRIEERAAKAKQRAQEKVDRELKRLQDKAARDTIAAMLKVDREVARIKDHAEKEAERRLERERKAQDRANREQEKDLKRHAREEARIRVQAEKEADRALEQIRKESIRDQKRSDREAAKWLRDGDRKLRREQRASARFATSMLGAGAQGVMAGASRIGGIAANMAGTAAQLGGGFSISGALAERGNLERSANLLANAAYIPGVEGSDKRQDPKAIIRAAQAASIETGMDASDLVGAVQSYVAKSADFKGGMANMKFFGTLAKATGSDVQDVANAAGILRVQNKDLDEKTMKQMLLDVIMQGKQGSVEFSDLATSAGRITRTSTSYVGDQAENQRRLLGLSQIGMGTAGSVQEGATVLANLSGDAGKHRADIERKIGKFTNEKGQITDAPETFLARVMKATGGNISAIRDMGFGERSVKMFQALSPTFNKAEKDALARGASKTSARQAGADAILKEMHQITDATYTEKALKEDHSAIMSGDMERFEASIRELKMRVGDELLPEFVKLIPVIRDLTPTFVSVLRESAPAFADLLKSVSKFVESNKWLIDNIAAHPIGSIMAASVVRSIAGAGLGPLIGSLIEKAFSGKGLVGNAKNLASSANSALGGYGAVAGGAAAAGVLTGAVIYNAGTKAFAGEDRAEDIKAKVDAWKRGDTERGMSPEAAIAEFDAAKERLHTNGGVLKQAWNIPASIVSDEASRSYGQFKSDQALVSALEKLVRTLESERRHGGYVGGSPSKPDARHEAISNR